MGTLFQNWQEEEGKKPFFMSYAVDPKIVNPSSSIIQVIQVVLTNHTTHIRLGHQLSSNDLDGISLQINPDIFIRPIGTSLKIPLFKTEYLPLWSAPPQYYLDPSMAILDLTFRRVPLDVCSIALVEPPFGPGLHYTIEEIQIREAGAGPIKLKWK